jgi:hypothetical protein
MVDTTLTKESLLFKVDTSVYNNPKALACIKKAIATWNCYTGVNWKFAADTLAVPHDTLDGVSDIYFSSTILDTNAIMQTDVHPDPTCLNFSDSINFVYDADIQMQRIPETGYVYSYDTTTNLVSGKVYYFYDIILHELGHALLLNHVIDVKSLMYFQAFLTQRVGITSGGVFPGPQTLFGADDVVRTSVARKNACKDGTLKKSTICLTDTTVGIQNISESTNNLSAFPNPIHNGFITIDYQLDNYAYIQFKIVDITGREVLGLNEEHKPAGTYSQEINIDNLAQGVYLFVANINGQFKTVKFIKI